MKQKPPIEIVYDLTPDMRIKLSDGVVVTLAELERIVQGGGKYFAYAPWSKSSNPRNTRIIVSLSGDGLSLHDFKTRISHRWATRKPQWDLPDAMAEILKALGGQRP